MRHLASVKTVLEGLLAQLQAVRNTLLNNHLKRFHILKFSPRQVRQDRSFCLLLREAWLRYLADLCRHLLGLRLDLCHQRQLQALQDSKQHLRLQFRVCEV